MNKKIIFILPAAALALTGCTLNPNGGQGNNLREHSNSGEVQKLRCKNFSIMVDEVIDVTTKITGGEFDVDDVVIEIVEGSEKYIELDGVELTGLKTGEAHILITVGDQELGDVKVTVKEKEEEDLTNYGTEDAPLTTSEAKLIADAQCQTADSFTKKDMYVKGQITNMMGSWDYGETGGAVEFMFSDGTTELHVYRAHAEMSVINQVKNGCNIVIYGEMKNDKRNGLQFADNGASHQVQIKRLTAGTKIEVTGIEFAKPSYELEVGASLEVKASVTPSNATEQGVTYELKNCSPAGCVTLSGNKVTGVAAGTATIVAKSTDKPQFTVEASITVKQGEDLSLKEFKMVTSNAEITSGTYLVSYVTDDKTYVMDGSLSKLDAVNNYVEATNNNGVIAATQDLKNVAVTFDKDTGFLQLPTGDYLDGNLTGNGLKVSTTGVAHEVTYSEGTASIVCGEYTLRFNNGSTQMRFRYYKGGQQAISLFKLVDKEEGGLQAVLDSIEVTTPPTKTAYEEGETFDPTGMVVTAHYTQGKADAVVTGYTYDKTGALAKGDTSITISYSEGSVTKTTTQTITVTESQIPPTPNPVLSSIEVTTQPTKVTYEEGETFDPTGMVVTAHYTQGKTDETVTTYSVDKTEALTTSDTTVTISYTEGTVTVTTTVTITVNEKQQEQRVSIPYSYAITGGALDDKWEQSSTENVKAFATNYIALRASGEWIQAKKLFDSRDSIRVVVTGVCNGTTTDSTVTVYGLDDNGAVVDGAVATYTPVKASASNQSAVDTSAHADAVVLNGTGITGVKIELTTKGHNYVVKQIDFLLPPVSVSSVSLDKTELAMTVNEADEQLTATVLPENAENKNVTWSSDHPEFATVSETGLVHAVAAGSATITATTEDGGKTASCAVTVTASEKILTGIEVTTQPAKVNYDLGDVFDPTGMVVTAHYSNAADETITNYTYSEEPLTVEDKTVTISWNGQTATVAITVVAPKGSTVNNPLSVSEAITKFSSLPSSETDSTKCWSSSRFFIQGKVKGYAASSSNKYTLVDTTDNTKEFIVYKSELPQDFTRAVINDIVVMEGFIENFKGTLEMTSYNDGTHNALPTTAAIIERGTSTVSLDSSSSANADVTFESTATNASSYSFTVAAKEGYQISSVKVNGTVVEGKEGTYTVDAVLGTMKILVETIAAGQKLPTTLTFNVTNYVSDNSIETQKDKLTSIDLDSVITASVTGSGNTGQFFGTTTNDWRIYAVGSLTITAASGYTIKTVKVTFATGNTATIKIGETEVSSKEVITVNGTEVVYSLTNGGTKTAQMKVQEIEVVYVEN